MSIEISLPKRTLIPKLTTPPLVEMLLERYTSPEPAETVKPPRGVVFPMPPTKVRFRPFATVMVALPEPFRSPLNVTSPPEARVKLLSRNTESVDPFPKVMAPVLSASVLSILEAALTNNGLLKVIVPPRVTRLAPS